MKVYTVRILDTVFADIGDYIVAVSTPDTRLNMHGSCRLRLCR